MNKKEYDIKKISGRLLVFSVVLFVLFFAVKLTLASVSSVSLTSPADLYWSNTNVTFTCSAIALGDTNVSRINLLVWNTSGSTAEFHNMSSLDYGYGASAVNGTLTVNFTVHNLTANEVLGGDFNWSWNCYVLYADDNVSYNASGNQAGNKTFNIDTIAPIVVFNHANNTVFDSNNRTDSQNRTFQFSWNATDDTGLPYLKNCSLYLENALNSTNQSTANNTVTNFSFTAFDYDDTIEWYIQCYDNASNANNATGVYFMDSLAIAVQHNGYGNDTWFDNVNPGGFNCTAASTTAASVNQSANITNLAFIVWNRTPAAGAQLYNNTINLTNVSENTVVSATFNLSAHELNISNSTSGANYSWNCIAWDNNSHSQWNISAGAPYNLTFGIDLDDPNVTMISPTDNTVDTDGEVSFKYAVSDASGETGVINNCSLYLDGARIDINTSTTLDTEVNFTITPNGNSTLEGEGLEWYVECFDKAGRSHRDADNWRISTKLDTSGSDSPASSGGGGGGAVATTPDTGTGFAETETQEVGDSFSFNSGGSGHSAKVKSIDYDNREVTITVSSTPRDVTIGEGESVVVDVDLDGDDDLRITVVDIVSAAKATILYEGIAPTTTETPTETPDVVQEETDASQKGPEEGMSSIWWWIVIGAIVVVLIIYFSTRKNK